MLTGVIIFVMGCVIAAAARRHLTFSIIALQVFLLAVVTLGALKLESRQNDLAETQTDIQQTQKQLDKERVVRSKVQAQINHYVCSENNQQDRLLAGLIQVSIGGSSTFGQGIDQTQLSVFQREVLEAVGRIQELSESAGQGDEFKSVFQRALEELRSETPCGTVVKAFLAASTTDDLKAIRRILKEASDGSLDKLKPHHAAK